MIREPLTERSFLREAAFRWRGREVSRLENLADVVFGFSLTLLVVALEVPVTSGDLFTVMRGFFGFAICFTILLYLWSTHYLFFRRYGLNDTLTLILNAVLLFLVLLYVYPLKFLFSYLTDLVWYHFSPLDEASRQELKARLVNTMSPADAKFVMVLYSAGYLGVAIVFILLHANAWRRRAMLELDATEELLTRATMIAHAINGGVAAVSIAVALAGHPSLAGFMYFILGPIHGVNGVWTRRRLAALAAAAG
jgi:uncharacterized membrane protein